MYAECTDCTRAACAAYIRAVRYVVGKRNDLLNQKRVENHCQKLFSKYIASMETSGEIAAGSPAEI